MEALNRTSAPRATRRVAIGISAATCLFALALPAGNALAAQPRVGLGTADPFAVLAGSAVTNVGPSVINGDLGVAPLLAVTGFPPGHVNGTTHAGDAVAIKAKSDLTTAYNDAAGRTPAATVTGDLGNRSLVPGVYKSASSLGLTGPLTLNAQGDPNAVFIFQAGSTLTTASASSVRLINGAQPCNVFWKVGSSATLGTASVFVGNILANASISMNNAVNVTGRALARTGAVTLINDRITAAHCATGTTGSTGGTSGTTGTGGNSGTSGTGTGTGTGTPGGTGNGTTTTAHAGTAVFRPVSTRITKKLRNFGTTRCLKTGFRVSVTGKHIKRVVFRLDGRKVATRGHKPFRATLHPRKGMKHKITARVAFTDATHAVTRTTHFRACAAAAVRVNPSRAPRRGGGFTG